MLSQSLVKEVAADPIGAGSQKCGSLGNQETLVQQGGYLKMESAPSVPTGLRPLRQVMDGITEGFGVLAPDFTILELNAEAVRIDGRPRESLIGRSHWDVYPGSEDSELGILYKRAMAERVNVSLMHRYQLADGRSAWLDMRAFPIDDGCLAILYRDVSEQHEREAQLRSSEARFRAAVAAVDGVVWTNTPDGRMSGEQPGWAALTGQEFRDYQDVGWADAVHPDDAQATIAAWTLAVSAKRPFEFEHRIRRHDGVWRWFAVRATPVLGEDGKIVEWAGIHRDITERRDTQLQLARNAESFATLVTSNPYGVYVVDADFRVSLVSRGTNSAFANIDPVEGRDFADVMKILWPEPTATRITERFRHTLETGEPYAEHDLFEERANVDAREAYDWRIERVALPDGRYGVVCYFYDLSALRRMQSNLDAALARASSNATELEALYEKAPLGLALLDSDLRFVRVNAALAEINGLPVSAHIGACAWDVLPDLRASTEPVLRHVLQTGKAMRNVSVVGTTPAQPGVIREWTEQFYPLRGPDGVITGIGVIADEVTERRRQERALRESEDELRRVLDQLYAFVGVLSLDGSVTYTNRAPLDAAGIDIGDVAGEPFEKTPWWSYDKRVQRELKDAIVKASAGNTVRYDVPVSLGNDVLTIDFQLAPLRDSEGELTALVASGVIIDERVQAEAALKQLSQSLEQQVDERTAELHAATTQLKAEIAKREAAQAALLQSQKLEAIGRVVAGVSHDFNNILATVLSGLSMIERKLPTAETRELVGMIRSSTQRGSDLIKQLLAFARQQPLAPEEVAIETVFEELRPLLEMSMHPSIRLKFECDPNCGSVRADPAQLHSALLNLAINARDAMPDGGTLRITALPASDVQDAVEGDVCSGDFVAIIVADTGTGMTAEVLARVAEPFFTTKEVGKGTGLGVSMVHGFAIQSGGMLHIESSPGAGTTMTLYLPKIAT